MRNRRTVMRPPAVVVSTPWKLRYPALEDKDRLFCHLIVLLGYSQSDAYRISYDSLARSSSLAAMACRRLQDPDISEYCHKIKTYYDNNPLEAR